MRYQNIICTYKYCGLFIDFVYLFKYNGLFTFKILSSVFLYIVMSFFILNREISRKDLYCPYYYFPFAFRLGKVVERKIVTKSWKTCLKARASIEQMRRAQNRSTTRRVALMLLLDHSISGPFSVKELNAFYAGRDLVQSQDFGVRAGLINKINYRFNYHNLLIILKNEKCICYDCDIQYNFICEASYVHVSLIYRCIVMYCDHYRGC